VVVIGSPGVQALESTCLWIIEARNNKSSDRSAPQRQLLNWALWGLLWQNSWSASV